MTHSMRSRLLLPNPPPTYGMMTRAGILKMRSNSRPSGNGDWQFVHTVICPSSTCEMTACRSSAQCCTGGARNSSS